MNEKGPWTQNRLASSCLLSFASRHNFEPSFLEA